MAATWIGEGSQLEPDLAGVVVDSEFFQAFERCRARVAMAVAASMAPFTVWLSASA